MKFTFRSFPKFLMVLFIALLPVHGLADDAKNKNPYLVLEGKVLVLNARTLVVDEQQYPISMYVRVFMGDEKGPEATMQMVANTGKIDKAKLYILGGKVEKIIILKNI